MVIYRTNVILFKFIVKDNIIFFVCFYIHTILTVPRHDFQI